MNQVSANQFSQLIRPGAVVNGASFTSQIIDTAGVGLEGTNKVEVVFQLGATDIALTALYLRESDDSGMSGATQIPGSIYGTSTNDAGVTSTLPSASDDNKIFTWSVDWQGGRKRYFDIVATVGSGSVGAYGTALAVLSRMGLTPVLATTMGAAENLNC